MENFTLKPPKFTKILSYILIGLSVASLVFFWLIEVHGGFWISFIFLLLGLLLYFSYKKEYIVFRQDDILISKLFKKTQVCPYSQIKTFLIVPMRNQLQFVLAGRNGEQITTLDNAFIGIDEGLDILEQHGTEIVNIAHLIETNQPIDAYIPALTKIQKINVQNMLEMQKSTEDIQEDPAFPNLDKTKKRLRILGIALCVIIGLSLAAGGKILFSVCIATLLFVYGMYIKYYPYMYLESISNKTKDYTLQMPFLAPIISILILMMTQKYFSFSFLSYCIFIFVMAVLLYIPFFMKVRSRSIRSSRARMISVFLAAIIIAYAISFPLNMLLTFSNPVHTDVTVTDKHAVRGKHDSWYVYVDDGVQFSMTKSEYHEIQKGDSMRICARKSLFGFEYSTLHK